MSNTSRRRIAARLVIIALVLAAVGCRDQGASPTVTPPQELLSPPAAATAIATPISPPRIDATPLVEITGLFSDPRPTHLDEQRSLGPKPAAFGAPPPGSTMLYDTASGLQTDLGPGGIGRFSPDGTRMVWIAYPHGSLGDGEVTLLEIASGARTVVATGRLAAFLDNDHVGVTRGDQNAADSIDLKSGATAALAGGLSALFPNFNSAPTPDGYELRREYLSDNPFPKSRFALTNPSTGSILLEFNAYAAVSAGRGVLAVATPPEAAAAPNRPGYEVGTTNIFLVDVASGRATFVATSVWASPNWKIAASDDYVIWTDAYCDSPQGHSRMLDRRTSRIAELDAALWPAFTPAGLIVDGPFGGQALIDPVTLEYRAVIRAFDVVWSPDYRYASIGQVGGHGGLCG